MALSRWNLLLALGLGLPVACASPPEPEAVAVTPGLKAFVGGRIIDGAGTTITDGVLISRDGRIEAVGPADAVDLPPDAEHIDLTGKTLVPGLVNAHGHVADTRGLETSREFYTREHVLDQLSDYAHYGVTTVFSLGGDDLAGIQLRDEQATGTLDRARLFVAGPVITADDPESARARVDEVADMGVDIVKIRVDDNLGRSEKMPEAVYEAVIDQAHERGLPVAAHLFYLEDAKKLVAAGADLLAHSVRDLDVDRELIDAMLERDLCLSPTLMREVSTFVYESRPDFFDDPFFLETADPEVLAQLEEPERQASVQNSDAAQQYKLALEVASRNVKALADAGVRIAFGTDTGPAGRFQGYFEQLELERLVEAGLTPAQALTSATRDAAACMNADDLGTLEVGKWADFVALDADPLTDIRNMREIDSVWIAGNAVRGGM